MLQSEVAYLRTQHDWIPESGAAELVPLALILIVLVARAKPLPGRGVLKVRNLGRAPRPRSVLRPAAVGVAAGFLLGPITTEWELPLVHAHLPFPLAPTDNQVLEGAGLLDIG